MQIFLVYFDDVIMFKSSMEAQVGHVDKVLNLPREEKVTVKLKKCSFFNSNVEYIGNTIFSGNLTALIDKSSSIHGYPLPEYKKKLC